MKTKKQKRLARKQAFLNRLTKSGIHYHHKNNCSYLYYIDVPTFNGIQFWPTTDGRWNNIKTGQKGVGVESLLKEVSESPYWKPVFDYRPEEASTEFQHKQQKIMDHFGMDFSK